ncbi:hypothetical protein QR680_010125 [Steinernema hermaphroditum]|uniref:Uncharacterized protein n=1 Tax=Steinernema hermaphroditum TaxID=289476 RepID=A0AA39IQF8_9BILA|nr:hypothetical protein QR680_010125 [Steinernema hermaphroditum]
MERKLETRNQTIQAFSPLIAEHFFYGMDPIKSLFETPEFPTVKYIIFVFFIIGAVVLALCVLAACIVGLIKDIVEWQKLRYSQIPEDTV